MIKVANSDFDSIKNKVITNYLCNVYLYIDVITYGFQGDSICTYVVLDSNSNVSAIIYEYFSSVQLMEFNRLTDEQIVEVSVFLLQHKYRRITGPSDLIARIYGVSSDKYVLTEGYLMLYSDCADRTTIIPDVEMFYASEDDFHEIARLICTDEHMKGSYTESVLAEQLIKRYKSDGCENLCVRCDGRIVSHIATYAVTDNIAVLSGMITDPQYRGRGYGSVLVRELSSRVLNSGRQPVLYCYDDYYLTWYEKLGYSIKNSNSKLELKNI